MANVEQKECFIIMPISDAEGYASGHFSRVYQDIVVPACREAGFKAVRADEVKETNLIHLDILNKLIDSPMAVCDLSARNPNVMFELGIRQSFDKPVVLIQEKGTPKIFDISPLRYLEYSSSMKYHEVIAMQKDLADAITATSKAGESSANTNSIVKLLALQRSAKVPDLSENKEGLAFDVIRAEIRQLKGMVERIMIERLKPSEREIRGRQGPNTFRIREIEHTLLMLNKDQKMPLRMKIDYLNNISQEVTALFDISHNDDDLTRLMALREMMAMELHQMGMEDSKRASRMQINDPTRRIVEPDDLQKS